MKASLRRGSALCALAALGLVAGCASPHRGTTRSASNFGGKIDRSNIGLATRAQAAMLGNRIGDAVVLAERAVANSPRDAGFRGLLGNIYLAAGRFGSAASAYRDSLILLPQQPSLVLKLALVEIALDRPGEAVALLDEARPALDGADYGLALALAGSSAEALSILDQAARQPGADGRVRQNLALAHALAGDWLQARTIAAQDLSAEQLDQRIAQWMQFTASGRPSDRVAALIGISPAIDSGMPVRLALAPQRVPASAALQRTSKSADRPIEPAVAVSAPVVMPLAPALEPQPAVQPVAEIQPVAELAQAAQAQQIAAVSVAKPIASTAGSAPAPLAAAAPAEALPAQAVATERIGRGTARRVVQLGAYGSLRRVALAWDEASRRFELLRDYIPTSARFESVSGTVYRLSVSGFRSEGEALSLCGKLRRGGGSCFVRSFAGDEPVRLAAR